MQEKAICFARCARLKVSFNAWMKSFFFFFNGIFKLFSVGVSCIYRKMAPWLEVSVNVFVVVACLHPSNEVLVFFSKMSPGVIYMINK